MIRFAEKKDIPRILALLSQVLEVHAKGRPDIFISGTTKYSEGELEGKLNDENNPIFVFADEEDTVQGYAFCNIEPPPPTQNMHPFTTLYIDDICVDERHRRQHIAQSLYAACVDYGKKKSCYHITLNVWALNDGAQAFYEAMGMKPLKTVMEQIL